VEIGQRIELFSEQQAETLIRDAQEVGRMRPDASCLAQP
jgi:hypothetical protein